MPGPVAAILFHGVLIHLAALGQTTEKFVNGEGSIDLWHHPGVWEDGTVRMLDVPSGWPGAYPVDINSSGQSVGRLFKYVPSSAYSSGREGVWGAVVWSGATAQEIGLPGSTSSIATAINDLGQVVGWSRVNGVPQAWLWHDGQIQALPGMRTAVDINNSGQIIGIGDRMAIQGIVGSGIGFQNLGVRLSNGTFDDLPMTDPRSINSAGQVVGNYLGTARLWSNGTSEDLPGMTLVLGINDGGQAVGFDEVENYSTTVYSNGSTDFLSALISTSANTPYLHSRIPTGTYIVHDHGKPINNSGQILVGGALWSGGILRTFPTGSFDVAVNGTISNIQGGFFPMAINDSGMVAGFIRDLVPVPEVPVGSTCTGVCLLALATVRWVRRQQPSLPLAID